MPMTTLDAPRGPSPQPTHTHTRRYPAEQALIARDPKRRQHPQTRDPSRAGGVWGSRGWFQLGTAHKRSTHDRVSAPRHAREERPSGATPLRTTVTSQSRGTPTRRGPITTFPERGNSGKRHPPRTPTTLSANPVGKFLCLTRGSQEGGRRNPCRAASDDGNSSRQSPTATRC